jgi:hypothetical protein
VSFRPANDEHSAADRLSARAQGEAWIALFPLSGERYLDIGTPENLVKAVWEFGAR